MSALTTPLPAGRCNAVVVPGAQGKRLSPALTLTHPTPRVRTLALDCVRQLLVWQGLTEAAQRGALRALLAAFHKEAPMEVEGEQPGEMQGARRAPGEAAPSLAFRVVRFPQPTLH